MQVTKNYRILTNTSCILHTDQYLHCSSHHQTSCKERIVSLLFNRAYSIIRNKYDLTIIIVKITHMLNENGYQEGIIRKIFKRITNNRNFSQSQQKMQATNIQEEEIRMSINLLS